MAELERDNTLQTLQNMINLVLVETGKALRTCNKDGTGSLNNTNSRHSSNLPSFIENFHLALDDLETEIILSKATLSRDLESLRTKRNALQAQCVEAKNQAISADESIDDLISKRMETVETKAIIGTEGFEKETQLANENQLNKQSSNLQVQKEEPDIHIIPEAQNIQSNLNLPTTKTQTTPDNLPSTQETKSQEANSSKLDAPVALEPSKYPIFDLPTDHNTNMFSTANLKNIQAGIHNSGTLIQDYSHLHNSDIKLFDMNNNSKDFSSTGYHTNGALGTSSNNDLNLGLHEGQKISGEPNTFINFGDLTGVDYNALNDNSFNDLF